MIIFSPQNFVPQFRKCFVEILALLFFVWHGMAMASSIEGTLSIHGFAPLAYTIELPPSQPIKAAVIFVPYFSEADRDGFADGSNITTAVGVLRDDSRYWQRKLAIELAKDGVVSMRYDALGVGCKPQELIPIDKSSPAEPGRSPFCVRSEETEQLVWADFSRALESAYIELRRKLPATETLTTIFIASSGSSMVVQDFLSMSTGENMRKRAALVGISAVAFAGPENAHWNKVDRPLDIFRGCQHSSPSECLEFALKDPFFRVAVSQPYDELDTIKKLDESDMEAGLRGLLEKNFSAFIAFEKNPTTRRRSPGGIVVSQDVASALQLRSNFPAKELSDLPVKLIFGSIDAAIDVDRHRQEWLNAGVCRTEIQVLKDVGHMLGSDPFWGPMSEEGFDAVRSSVLELARLGTSHSSRQCLHVNQH